MTYLLVYIAIWRTPTNCRIIAPSSVYGRLRINCQETIIVHLGKLFADE